ncbi:SDR family NAD(P)-dependent oxidoreductase [Photobacterium sp. MCCC 1A19761]|uniref:SDR family NAD(P)-dependent oxidoreductase n=1 Tax=Photobacterium sp. MCCC 1A19761 TaxID=3115000 RepID=UPI00307F3698
MIAGGSGGIGQALVTRCLANGDAVTAMTRSPSHTLCQLQKAYPNQLAVIQGELSQAPESTRAALAALFDRYGYPDWVINAAGVLHQAHVPQLTPEKRLSEITPRTFELNLTVNTYTSIVLAQWLAAFYPRQARFRFACLSAMVGSISDNRSGGWYSYRMSKAALNMFIKTLSIEWRRQFPQASVAAIHPGTTKTPLSAPFRDGIDPRRYYTPAQSAERILRIVSTLTPEQSGRFFHWDGSELPW